MLNLVVVKKDGRREPFDRVKLRLGIQKACEKRPISSETIESLVDQVEIACRCREETEVTSNVIGEMVMDKLRALDKVAYIRFASDIAPSPTSSRFRKSSKFTQSPLMLNTAHFMQQQQITTGFRC